MTDLDRSFARSIAEIYDRHLVPLIFEPFADDLAMRAAALQPSQVLEIAAGTGVVTRRLADRLPLETAIVATDLNSAMLEQAVAVGTSRPVEWQPADALKLPFPDESFDLVVCQFGVMFFPDKPAAFGEARRVLRPGGRFLFNVWDRIERNEFADTVTEALAEVYPDDPPRFMARIPHGYHDVSAIGRDLVAAGFARTPEIVTLKARSRAECPRVPAVAYCEGTPLRNEIEARAATGGASLQEATDHATAATARRFGSGLVDGLIQAHVVGVER